MWGKPLRSSAICTQVILRLVGRFDFMVCTAFYRNLRFEISNLQSEISEVQLPFESKGTFPQDDADGSRSRSLKRSPLKTSVTTTMGMADRKPGKHPAALRQGRSDRNRIAQLESECWQYQRDVEMLARKLENTGVAYRTLLRLLVSASIEEDLLQAGIEALANLIHARYGAILLLGKDESKPVRMLFTGISAQEAEKIGKLPEGHGLLGIALGETEVLRIDDMAKDPRSRGFPPHHPLMRSVVIAPIANEGQFYGRVYLCNKLDDRPFSDDDALIVQSFSHSLALVAGYARAVAERKHAQEATALLESQLRQVQKLEALGRLAGGVAHDFNNLLTAIIGYGELTLSFCRPEAKIRRNIEEILKTSRRGATLISQLLAFGRKQASARVVVSLEAVISNLSPMIQRLIGEDIDLIVRCDRGPGNILIDQGQMEQVLLNMVVNARDAMPRGGKLVIETTRVALDGQAALRLGNLSPGPYVALIVKDTGCGMSPEICTRVFEPFFTTKEQGKGTGLGLSTVYGIITQHGGSISVESEPGQGTTFTVYLPQVGGLVPEPEAHAPRACDIGGIETILVVEDETEVRSLMCEYLRNLGYSVLEAGNGDEALEIGRRASAPIHLLLTDMIMPRHGGQELAGVLSSVHPKMKILYISGYVNHAILPDGEMPANSAFLAKPFSPETLGRTVRSLLDAN